MIVQILILAGSALFLFPALIYLVSIVSQNKIIKKWLSGFQVIPNEKSVSNYHIQTLLNVGQKIFTILFGLINIIITISYPEVVFMHSFYLPVNMMVCIAFLLFAVIYLTKRYVTIIAIASGCFLISFMIHVICY